MLSLYSKMKFKKNLGMMSNSLDSFLNMMKELGFDGNSRNFIVRRLVNITDR